MIDVRKPSEIEEGMIGVVKEFPDQKEEDFREDIIVKKISSAEFEPDGTKVELKNGSIGNLQFISHSENDIQLIKIDLALVKIKLLKENLLLRLILIKIVQMIL